MKASYGATTYAYFQTTGRDGGELGRHLAVRPPTTGRPAFQVAVVSEGSAMFMGELRRGARGVAKNMPPKPSTSAACRSIRIAFRWVSASSLGGWSVVKIAVELQKGDILN